VAELAERHAVADVDVPAPAPRYQVSPGKIQNTVPRISGQFGDIENEDAVRIEFVTIFFRAWREALIDFQLSIQSAVSSVTPALLTVLPPGGLGYFLLVFTFYFGFLVIVRNLTRHGIRTDINRFAHCQKLFNIFRNAPGQFSPQMI
jgi:hypothetical protein